MFHLYHDPEILLQRKNSRQYSSQELADVQRAYDTLVELISGLVVLPVKTAGIECTEDFLVTQLAARRILWPTEVPIEARAPTDPPSPGR